MKFQKDIIIPVTMVDDLKKFIYTGKSVGRYYAKARGRAVPAKENRESFVN